LAYIRCNKDKYSGVMFSIVKNHFAYFYRDVIEPNLLYLTKKIIISLHQSQTKTNFHILKSVVNPF
jgi:hypothetical protein